MAHWYIPGFIPYLSVWRFVRLICAILFICLVSYILCTFSKLSKQGIPIRRAHRVIDPVHLFQDGPSLYRCTTIIDYLILFAISYYTFSVILHTCQTTEQSLKWLDLYIWIRHLYFFLWHLDMQTTRKYHICFYWPYYRCTKCDLGQLISCLHARPAQRVLQFWNYMYDRQQKGGRTTSRPAQTSLRC